MFNLAADHVTERNCAAFSGKCRDRECPSTSSIANLRSSQLSCVFVTVGKLGMWLLMTILVFFFDALAAGQSEEMCLLTGDAWNASDDESTLEHYIIMSSCVDQTATNNIHVTLFVYAQ